MNKAANNSAATGGKAIQFCVACLAFAAVVSPATSEWLLNLCFRPLFLVLRSMSVVRRPLSVASESSRDTRQGAKDPLVAEQLTTDN